MTDNLNKRKFEHVSLFSQDSEIERQKNHFDQIKLTHRALPEINLSDVDTKTSFLNKELSFPFVISSMTGGNSSELVTMNQNLAIAAEECQVAMGVGSQRITLTDKKAKKSFNLRAFSPTIPLIANIGAVQLNYGITVDDIRRMVDEIQADALYLHFNPLQEVVQPEGDTQFANLSMLVRRLVMELDCPIIAKEIGCGFSNNDLYHLKEAGIQWVDVAGQGGTSWSRLENHRRENQGINDDLGILFQDWGIPTPQAIAITVQHKAFNIIASGGIRSGIDIAKSIVIGADYCACAAPLLESAQQSSEAVIKKIKQLHHQLKVTQFLTGCKNLTQLKKNHSLIHSKEN